MTTNTLKKETSESLYLLQEVNITIYEVVLPKQTNKNLNLTKLLDLSKYKKNRKQRNKVNIIVKMQSSTQGKSFLGNPQDKQSSSFPIKLLEGKSWRRAIN